MSREQIQRINARVLAVWKGASHGGIDPEELPLKIGNQKSKVENPV